MSRGSRANSVTRRKRAVAVKVVKAVEPEDDECLDEVCDDEDPLKNISNVEEAKDKKQVNNGRRFFGPFKCTDCGKILSSKVICRLWNLERIPKNMMSLAFLWTAKPYSRYKNNL